MAQRLTVFVLGCPRSGTTALAELLNTHRSVCMGVERFKFHLRDRRRISPDVFTKQRFFDFRPEDTDYTPANDERWRVLYPNLELRWDSALVIGDKIPSMFYFLPQMEADYPDAKYIYIWRNPTDVAASWISWQNLTGQGFEEAVRSWNNANRAVGRRMACRRKQWHAIRYEDFFAGDDTAPERLMRFLELDEDVAFAAAYKQTVATYVNTMSRKPRELDQAVRGFIEKERDRDAERAIVELVRASSA